MRHAVMVELCAPGLRLVRSDVGMEFTADTNRPAFEVPGRDISALREALTGGPPARMDAVRVFHALPRTDRVLEMQAEVRAAGLLDLQIRRDDGSVQCVTYSGDFVVLWAPGSEYPELEVGDRPRHGGCK